jgi:hypothetical protein
MGVNWSLRRLSEYHTVYMRLALAAGFLSAVTDRLGWWGPYGVGVLIGVVAIASLSPELRAMSVDPVATLRE